MNFHITPVEDKELRDRLRQHVKKVNSSVNLEGTLERLVLQIGLVQRSFYPVLRKPLLLYFAGDHYPYVLPGDRQEATPPDSAQQMDQLLNGSGIVQHLCQVQDVQLKVVDMGVDQAYERTLNYWLHRGSRWFNRKIAFGTRDITAFPAMTSEECTSALTAGARLVKQERKQGCNTIGFGALGKNSTVSTFALLAALMDVKPARFALKAEVEEIVSKALRTHPKTHDPLTLLTLYGGYETAAITGAILQAAEKKMLILINGWRTLTALLVASRLKEKVLDYCVFCDSGSKVYDHTVQQWAQKKPLLRLSATEDAVGVVLTWPLLQNAIYAFYPKKD